MAIDLVAASPVTGGDSGAGALTSPTYTFLADGPPVSNSKQWIVSALGGTQTNVRTHYAYSPFSITVYKPVNPKLVGLPDQNGVIRNVPMNEYSVVLRKGVIPAPNQSPVLMTLVLKMRIPAGSEVNDTPNVMAGISALIGALKAQDNQIGDMPVYNLF